MSKKRQISQLNNFNTYLMMKRQLMTLAENVFIFKNLPDIIDLSYLNKTLTKKGSIAFYYDDILESVIALPYDTIGKLDIYDRPTTIQCRGKNGYNSKILNNDEYIIMYDNLGRYPIFADLEQYTERLALIQRVIDINITQQKTPRIFKAPQELMRSIEDFTNYVDSGIETILTYDKINLDDIETILTPAPFVTDKLRIEYNNLWNECMRIIGISNISIQKKERMLSDEINSLQGGTIASRYNRFEPRLLAVEQINKKFNLDIQVEYYDKLEDSETSDIKDTLNTESEV